MIYTLPDGQQLKITIELLPAASSIVAPKKDIKLSNLAHLIGGDESFADFARKNLQEYIKQFLIADKFMGGQHEKIAQLIRFICSVESRSELDSNADAAEQFNRAILGPYNLYKQHLGDNHE
jgi:hypothetical protein